MVDDRLTGVRLASGEVVARQALVVASFPRARTEHVTGLGLAVEDLRMGDLVLGTRIAAEARGRTAVPGVWVAGNAVEPMAQVVGAMTAGLLAGAQLNMDLITEDVARLVAVGRPGRVSSGCRRRPSRRGPRRPPTGPPGPRR